VKTLRSQKLRMLLTHRKLLQSKAIAIENDLRGTLRNFGLKNDSTSPYYPKDFKIFLQGSYKNDTNVYGDSDVDVVIRLDEIYYTDLDQLPEGDNLPNIAERCVQSNQPPWTRRCIPPVEPISPHGR
jgi:hypothetical protein